MDNNKKQVGLYPVHGFCESRTQKDSVIEFKSASRIRIDKNNRLIKLSTFIFPLLIIVILSINSFGNCSNGVDSLLPGDSAAQNEVDRCEACRLVVQSFEKGMDETSRGKHEGGDTSWEERNLKSYADSEVRLTEIQEKLCEDVKSGKNQCLSLAEDTESEVEEWWFKQRSKNVRLFDYLCISKLKRCCPDGKFGLNCQPCPSSCNQHGVCDGSGSRQGTGKCQCHFGYIGEECEGCEQDHYRIATSDHFTCRQCDLSCKGCYGPGKNNCTECRSGYYKHEVNGCIDINECEIGLDGIENAKLCKENSYCVNTDGAYRCADCHIACAGCVGYGSDMCISCARGYHHDDDYVCRSEDELDELETWRVKESLRNSKGSLARYFFYVGVLAISVVMFRSNLAVLYTLLLGFIIALTLSEFSLLGDVQDSSKVSSD